MPSPTDYPAFSEQSALSSGHALLLITAGGLLGMAALLETAVHDHDAHHHVPAAVHWLAIISAVLSLWPALRNVWLTVRTRRLHWHLVVVAGVIATIAAGKVMTGSLAALLFSLGLFIWRRVTRTNKMRPSH